MMGLSGINLNQILLETELFKKLLNLVVPEARIELARGKTSTDFKSVASTNSATRAKTRTYFIKNQRRCLNIYKINKHQLPNINFAVVKILSKISQAVNNTIQYIILAYYYNIFFQQLHYFQYYCSSSYYDICSFRFKTYNFFPLLKI